MTTLEFEKLVKEGVAQVLTLKLAESLKGKKLLTMYFGDKANCNEVRPLVIKDIITEFSYYENKPMEGYKSHADYWEKKLPKTAERAKNTLLIIDENNENTFMFIENMYTPGCSEPTFVCSDSDRYVFFVEEDKND